jgi:hypothetical protein
MISTPVGEGDLGSRIAWCMEQILLVQSEHAPLYFPPRTLRGVVHPVGNHHLLILLKFCVCLFKVFQPGDNPVVAIPAEKHVVDHVRKFVLNVGISEPMS